MNSRSRRFVHTVVVTEGDGFMLVDHPQEGGAQIKRIVVLREES